MIDISKLTEADKGRFVTYRAYENGRIKGWNREVIWVVYRCDGRWEDFEQFTAEPTDPDDLIFKNGVANMTQKR